MDCHLLLQGNFPTQGSNLCLLCLLHWQAGFVFCFFKLVPSGKLPCPLGLSQKLGVRLENRHHKVLPMSTYFAFSPLIHFPPTLHNYHLHTVPGSSVISLLLRRVVRVKSQKELVGGSDLWRRVHLLLGDWSENSTDQISRSVVSDSLRPHESQHTRPLCPSSTPGVHSDSHPSNP